MGAPDSEDGQDSQDGCGCTDPRPRLLVVPGLNDSPPGHWQSWLQAQCRGAVRVVQRDWATPDVERWAGRIGSALDRAGPGPWIVAAHSFGVVALARYIALQHEAGRTTPLAAALLVAPADPDKFGVAGLLPQGALGLPSTMVLSSTDPWLSQATGQRWARRWGSAAVHLGDAGHINVAAGFGPLPLAHRWVVAAGQRLQAQRRAAREEAPAGTALAV